MERIFVNRNFSYIDVVNIPNGESWTVDRLSKQIGSLYRAKDIHVHRIIVWFDREKRQEDCANIKSAVVDELVAAGVSSEKIIVCIPDRMTENIILADEVLVRERFEKDDYCYPGDGLSGKGLMKELHNLIGKSYKETFHGADLLKRTVLSRAAVKSPSARDFYENFDLDCWWNR